VSPMILSDKVAGIIKDLQVQVGIKDVQLNSAMRRIEELNRQVEELVVEVAELQERLGEG
jgi:tetrahydromethanopterin S-methyltransferase subunit G